MAGIVEPFASAADASVQFEQVHEKIKQLLSKANEAKASGELNKAQKLLIQAWKLTIKDIGTRKL